MQVRLIDGRKRIQMERVTTGQIGQLIERANASEPQVDFNLMQFFLCNLEKVRKLMLGAFTRLILKRDTIKDRVAAGNYDWANKNINDDNFELTEPEGDVEVVLFHPNKMMTSEEVIAAMAEAGLKPALIDHLLAYGEQHSEVQLEFPIVCLGSECTLGSGRSVPYLGRWEGRRRLDRLSWFAGLWREDYRFLAVRNG